MFVGIPRSLHTTEEAILKGFPMYNLKKYTVWCFRIPKNSSSRVSCARPCAICLKRLKELGFGKIAFTNINGEIEIHKINELKSTHLSFYQKINRNIVKI